MELTTSSSNMLSASLKSDAESSDILKVEDKMEEIVVKFVS